MARAALRALGEDLWVAEAPLRFLGLEVGARMTVIRLPGPKLFVHSPIPAGDALFEEVRALGPVSYLVAPNRYHHLYLGPWRDRCPDAALFVAPGLETKRRDLADASVLTDRPESAWAGALDQVLLSGLPLFNEVVFFHRASATLIVCDVAFNVGEKSAPVTRLVFRLGGGYGRVGPTYLERLLVRDRSAFRQALRRVLEWPFERVVVAHGEVSEAGGREELRRGYDWLLREP